MDPKQKGNRKSIPVTYEPNLGRRPNLHLLSAPGAKRAPQSLTQPWPAPVTPLPACTKHMGPLAKLALGRGKKGRQARLNRRHQSLARAVAA